MQTPQVKNGLVAESLLSEEEKRTIQQIISYQSNLIVLSPYKNHSLYFKALALSKKNNLTLVILPSSAAITREIGYLKTVGYAEEATALSSDLFPNQARKLIAEVADGEYKLLFLTPESFLYWFSSGFNSMAVEHYRKLSEDDLGKQVFGHTQAILDRVSRVVFEEFELVSKDNIAHKPKYLEVVSLISELDKPILALSCNSSDEILKGFLRYFPNTPVIYESLRLDKLSLQAKFCFSRLDKQKRLVELLQEKKSTLVYVSHNENLAELVNYLRKKLPDMPMKAFHKQLSPEQKAEALDYFLHDPAPVFITSSELMEGINREYTERLIHFSPPNSLAEYYKDLHIIHSRALANPKSSLVAESHVLICEDDFKFTPAEQSRLQGLYNRDGLVVNRKKQINQLLEWVANRENCRWQNLEQVLTSNIQQQSKCGICDLCKGEKTGFTINTLLFFLQKKFK